MTREPRIPHDIAEALAVAAVAIVLREAVTVHGVTGSELAELLGVSRARVSQMLSGHGGNPTVRTLARIANAMDMDLHIELRPRSSANDREPNT